jgi:hypothetical protein
MSEGTKKVEKIEQEVKPAELSEQDLEQVAGGAGAVATDKNKDYQKQFPPAQSA